MSNQEINPFIKAALEAGPDEGFDNDCVDTDMTDMIHYERQCSEFCGFCGTRHHPEQPCQED